MTLGDIAVAIGLGVRVVTMSGWVMWTAIGIFDGVGQVQEGMRTFAQPRAVDDAPEAPTLAAPRGEIRFDDVTFHYGKRRGRDRASFSLTIAAGRKGRPGRPLGRGQVDAGQPAAALLRRREPAASSSTARTSPTASQESLRRKIGMVTQDTSLLHRSIADNILYGRPRRLAREMIAAARAAHADEFIADLADREGRVGYDTLVGERGVKLSGGQRQRIAIARVMLKDAPILVLDEATSALDSEIEQAIQENLQTLMAGKTVIAIAHRLSTIAAMDRLVVLDERPHRRDGFASRADRARAGSTRRCGAGSPAASSRRRNRGEYSSGIQWKITAGRAAWWPGSPPATRACCDHGNRR